MSTAAAKKSEAFDSREYWEKTDEELVEELLSLDLPEEDGEPLEDVWHRVQINFLIDMVKTEKGKKEDYFVGGNMFVYYSLQQVKNRDYKGPDFFYVEGARIDPNRGKWVAWVEDGKYPDVIIELLSPSTKKEDLGRKKKIYEKIFKTGEYFCFDHDENKLYGWKLTGSGYEEISPDEDGRMESKVLGYKLGSWRGTYLDEDLYLRFFYPSGEIVFTQAEEEKARAEAEKARADRLEKELEELKTKMASS